MSGIPILQSRRLASVLSILMVIVAGPSTAEAEVVRLGIIGLDTSHVIAFTELINGPDLQSGCRVIAAYPGGSEDLPASADRVEELLRELHHGEEGPSTNDRDRASGGPPQQGGRAET